MTSAFLSGITRSGGSQLLVRVNKSYGETLLGSRTEASCQRPRCAALEVDPPAPVKPSDDAAPADSLMATSGQTLSQERPDKLLLSS